jgi:NADH dehydrogenase
MRGVSTVVHLASAIRDQRSGSIEELNGIATWRMVEAAERAGVERFVFLSALGATAHDRTRFMRAKALAEDAVASSGLSTTIAACSLVYVPGDSWLALIERLALLPFLPQPGNGRALFQPIWAQDAADCLAAVLARAPQRGRERLELAGPETLSGDAIVRTVLRAAGRERPLLHVPEALVRALLRSGEALLGPRAPLTWDEAELLQVSATSARGIADAQSLGVEPRTMAGVVGA